MKLLSNYIAIHEVEKETQTESGIYTGASKNKDIVRAGVVVGVGPGISSLTSGTLIPTDPDLKPGSAVLVNVTNSIPVTHGGETLHLLKTTDVVAVLSTGE